MPELGQRPDAAVVEPRGPGRACRAVERARRVRPPDGAVGDGRPERAERRVELDERRRQQQEAALGRRGGRAARPPPAPRPPASRRARACRPRARGRTCSACRAGGVITTTTSTAGSPTTSATSRYEGHPGAAGRELLAPLRRMRAHRPELREACAQRVDRAVRGRRRARCRHPENRRRGAQFSRCGALAMIMK